ncbi:MAG: transporter [Verrucomicrobia bacterium]|nr:transporter [Verrucomicrobiota bacterium]
MLRFLASTLLLPVGLFAGEPAAPSKVGYTLFNPTPRDQLRDLATDRPDTTESAITVDAGHFQLELSFLDQTRNRDRDGVRTEGTVIAPFLLKVGLTNRVDLQFGFDPWIVSRTRTPGQPTETFRGVGDVTLRLKINLWGNDGPEAGYGNTAFALMPFLKLPTARRGIGNGRFEGGLIAPFSVELPAGFSLSMVAAGEFVRDDANRRYGLEIVHTASLGRRIFGELRGYAEYVGVTPTRTGSTYRAFFSTGLTLGLGKNAQLDVGTRIGLNHAADDLNVFSGLSMRF